MYQRKNNIKWWNKPVSVGFFIKLLICINIVYWILWYNIATISDYKSNETLDYYEYLENRIYIQSDLINVQRELINLYKK